MAGRAARAVAASVAGDAAFLLRIKFIVKTTPALSVGAATACGVANLLFFLFCWTAKAPPQNTPSCAPRKPIAPLRARNSVDHTLPQPFFTSVPPLPRSLSCSQSAALPTRLLLRLCAAAISTALVHARQRTRASCKAHSAQGSVSQRRLHLLLRRTTLARPRDGPRDLLVVRTSKRKSHPRGAKPRHGLLQDLPS